MEIIEIAKEYAAKSDSGTIREIEIEVGEMSGIIKESLESAFDIAIKDTVLENAKTIIINIQGKALCNSCQTEFNIKDLYTSCPECEKYDFKIINGKELRVRSITVD